MEVCAVWQEELAMNEKTVAADEIVKALKKDDGGIYKLRDATITGKLDLKYCSINKALGTGSVKWVLTVKWNQGEYIEF